MTFIKRRSTVFVLALVLSQLLIYAISFAQSAEQPGTKQSSQSDSSNPKRARAEFGVKAGLRISNLPSDGQATMDPRLSFALAGFLKYGSDMIAFQPEIWYAQNGCKGPFYILSDGELYGLDATFSFSYLNVPLLFKFHNPLPEWFGNKDKSQRMFLIGPVIGIKLASEVKGSGTSFKIGNAKSVVLGWVIGADASWRAGRTTKIYMDARFEFGGNPYNHNMAANSLFIFDPETGKAPDVSNAALSLMFGLSF
ncbi:MAG: porin family protein [candidate division Zixibacteria bacterium]|nr:porin family protein [candidate division Zixibacteria bacterium]